MAEGEPTINVEEIVKKLNSQIENSINERMKGINKDLQSTNADIQKLAELGKQQSEQLANLVTNVNDLGKRIEGAPTKRISKTEIEETGKGFETLLEE